LEGENNAGTRKKKNKDCGFSMRNDKLREAKKNSKKTKNRNQRVDKKNSR